MNENQKKVTETYRSNYDAIFGKKKEQESRTDDAPKSNVSNEKGKE